MKKPRKRGILKSLKKQYSLSKAYSLYSEIFPYKARCVCCNSIIDSYSEWHETGYCYEKCPKGCYSITTYGLTVYFVVDGYLDEKSVRSSLYDDFGEVEYEKLLNKFDEMLYLKSINKPNLKLLYTKKS